MQTSPRSSTRSRAPTSPTTTCCRARRANGETIAYGAYVDAYGLLDGRLTLADVPLGSGRLAFALWGKNLADKEWVADSIGSFRGFAADRLAAYGEPRTYGLTVTYDL